MAGISQDAGGEASRFRLKSMMGVSVAALLILTPFSINNFIQGRYLLGIGTLGIILILAVSAWGSLRGRYYKWLAFLVLAPAIIAFLGFALRAQGIIGALWCFPAAVSFDFILPERLAWIASAALFAVALPQAWWSLDHATAVRVAATLVTVSVFSGIFVRVISSQQRELKILAVTDALTGVFNRTPLSSALQDAVQMNRRSGVDMTLVALDLDKFKSINDTLGHDSGDRVLRSLGELLRKRLRSIDKVFRMGGEEFQILLFATNRDGGRKVAEELRCTIEALDVLPGRVVTASFGVASLMPDEDSEQWLKRCDQNLYQAKAGGRNRVVVG